MNRKIVFRADAGYKIGYGHYIRSLALADMLKEEFECEIYTSEPSSYQIKIANKICRLYSLPSDDSKFEFFLSKLRGDEIVVLDNYFYDLDYQKEIISKGCKLVCIDDRPGVSYFSDAVINHVVGITANEIHNYRSDLKFLGPQYALLRSEFREPSLLSWNCESTSIMVALGGVDYENNAYSLCVKLREVSDCEINVVVGDGYKGISTLKNLGVKIFKNLSASELCDLIRKQLLVICTPSTIAYEVASLGIPMVVGSYADNHHAVERGIVEAGIGIGCGNLSEVSADRLKCLIEQAKSDKRMSDRQHFFFDGNQKSRFVSIFKKLC